MDWLSVLLDKLSVLWPFVRINIWEGAVRETFFPSYYTFHFHKPYIRYVPPRVRVDTLGPGTHLRLWWWQDIADESKVEQVYNLPTQSITTKDGASVSFSANITFKVTDVLLNLTEVHNFPASLEGAAMVHLAQRVREQTWVELVEHQRDLERSLKNTLTTRVKKWGVEIVDVGLTDLVKSKAFRLFGDPYKA